MTRLTFAEAKRLCGLEKSFDIRTEEHYTFVLSVWRDLTVAARKNGNDALAADLSQCKEVFKRRYYNRAVRKCPRCGGIKSVYANHCQLCSLTSRFYPNQVYTKSVTMKEHEIEEGLVMVPPRYHGSSALSSICYKIATTGQVGDSFITDRQPTSIKNSAKKVGMEITTRLVTLEERDPKKRRWRVWRTDGLPMEVVNQRIQDRLAGKEVPPSPPCKPPAEKPTKKAGRPSGVVRA